MPGEKSARRRGVVLVLIATVLWSMGGLFARALGHLDVWTVVGWRAALGAVSISVVGLVEWRRGRLDQPFGFGSLSPLVALLATVAIAAYTAALMTTTVADVMVIYATIPFVAAAIGWLVNREAVDRRTLIASVVAFAGVADHFRQRPRLGPARRTGAVGADDGRLRRHDRAAAPPAQGLDDRRQRRRRAGGGLDRALALAPSAARPFRPRPCCSSTA